jgi:uncharacterized membrane protein
MAQATDKARRGRRRQTEEEPPEGKGEAPETRDEEEESAATGVTGAVEDVGERARGTAEGGAAGVAGLAGGGTLMNELRTTVREAALEVLRPLAREVTTSAAKTAATKGPDLVKDKVMPKVAEAGGPGALAKGALEKGGEVAGGLTKKFGRKGKAPSGTGRGRRLPVQEQIDVGVDLETAYDQWTQFEEFPQFMHRVEKVEQVDDETLMWHENIWGVRRAWQAEITDQQPTERIVWQSTDGPKQIGVVTFHRLSDRLTRIEVTLDFQPEGLFEKFASGTRITRRALRSDLMRFKAYVEMNDEATGAWRGRIEEGDVVDRPGGAEEEEPEAEEEEPEAEEEEEPEAEAEEEPEEEEEEEEQPPRRQVRRRRPSRATGTATRRRR